MPDIIPFIPFKLDKAKKVSQSFRGAAQKLLKYFPNLEINLIQGRVDIEAVSYLSIILFSTIFWFSLITAVMFGAVLIATPAQIIANLYLIFLVSGSVTILAFFYLVFYPLVRARARTRTLERDLLFALSYAFQYHGFNCQRWLWYRFRGVQQNCETNKRRSSGGGSS